MEATLALILKYNLCCFSKPSSFYRLLTTLDPNSAWVPLFVLLGGIGSYNSRNLEASSEAFGFAS